MRRLPLTIHALAALGALAACSPDIGPRTSVRAIISGAPDTGHPAVGLLLLNASGGTATGICSATLVGQKTVLTAAHCLTGTTVEKTILEAPKGQLHYAASLHPHPSWNKSVSAYLNDIGLVILKQPAGISPAKLSSAAPTAGTAITIVGYGRSVVDDPKTSGTKRLGNKTIASVSGGYFTVTGLQGNCAEGDSGGASFATIGGTEVQVGVNSASTETFDTSYHVRVDAFMGWLKTTSGGDLGDRPLVAILSPPEGANVPPSFALKAAVTYAAPIKEVEVLVGTTSKGKLTAPPYELQLQLPEGAQTIRVVARDQAGIEGDATRHVTVKTGAPADFGALPDYITPATEGFTLVDGPAAGEPTRPRPSGGCATAPGPGAASVAPLLLLLAGVALWRRRGRR
jgi:uncharacterized protein (TIGR03382 family)